LAAPAGDSREAVRFLAEDRQFLQPSPDVLAGAESGTDGLIDVTGRAAAEAALLMSASLEDTPTCGC